MKLASNINNIKESIIKVNILTLHTSKYREVQYQQKKKYRSTLNKFCNTKYESHDPTEHTELILS